MNHVGCNIIHFFSITIEKSVIFTVFCTKSKIWRMNKTKIYLAQKGEKKGFHYVGNIIKIYILFEHYTI